MTIAETLDIWLDRRDCRVIPIVYQEKRPEAPWKEYQSPDSPILSPDERDRLFNHGDHNVAIVTGHHGLTVIDFDNMHVFSDWLSYGEKNPAIALIQCKTYQVQTSKGRHIYVRLPEATRSRPLLKQDGSRWGIDIKSRGGYVMIPPSIHPGGQPYREINPGAPIMFVQVLSDILPPEMLMQVEFQPPSRPARAAPTGDIWDRAMSATVAGPGTVDKIKAALKIEDLFSSPLTQTGGHHYVTLCPLHDDHNPSMWVDTDQQICGCYAGCTPKPLDVIDLYARINGLTTKDAIHELRDKVITS